MMVMGDGVMVMGDGDAHHFNISGSNKRRSFSSEGVSSESLLLPPPSPPLLLLLLLLLNLMPPNTTICEQPSIKHAVCPYREMSGASPPPLPSPAPAVSHGNTSHRKLATRVTMQQCVSDTMQQRVSETLQQRVTCSSRRRSFT